MTMKKGKGFSYGAKIAIENDKIIYKKFYLVAS
jgi:hypothetical protein